MFALDRVRDLVFRLRGVLAPDGQIAVATWMRDRGPVGAAFGVQMLVATDEGDAHSWSDYRRVCRDAGYSAVRLVEVGRPALGVVLAAS